MIMTTKNEMSSNNSNNQHYLRELMSRQNTEHIGSIIAPDHYRIPNESGYFPAGSDEADGLLAKVDNATLYQTHPRPPPGRVVIESSPSGDYGDEEEAQLPPPLASGTFTLRDPSAGTADDVSLVCRCGDTCFYVMCDDAAIKTSESTFVIMLPKDCIVVDLTGCSSADVLRVEMLFAARTKFHDESATMEEQDGKPPSGKEGGEYPENLPDDKVSRIMFKTSVKVAQLTVRAGEIGASKIEAYGEKKRENVTQSREVKVGKTSIMVARGARTMADNTFLLTSKVSDKLSDVLGGKMGKAVVAKETDSATKRRARALLLASALSYAEVGNGAHEGYEIMVKSAQSQATLFVAEKYGKEAAELARHTTGAAVNFGRAALTARRVVNVKKIVKSAGKQMVKEGVKSSI